MVAQKTVPINESMAYSCDYDILKATHVLISYLFYIIILSLLWAGGDSEAYMKILIVFYYTGKMCVCFVQAGKIIENILQKGFCMPPN